MSTDTLHLDTLSFGRAERPGSKPAQRYLHLTRGGAPRSRRRRALTLRRVAVAREAYLRIGGHDEAFLGWGGEDNEFYDRCRLLRFHPWGYLPFLHLWHAPQPGKVKPGGTLAYLDEAMAVPREERARKLAAHPFGSPEGPLLARRS